jgi:hypothetical protein
VCVYTIPLHHNNNPYNADYILKQTQLLHPILKQQSLEHEHSSINNM